MDRIQAMQVFNRVVETGGFTRAAESMNLPKGSVTKVVQQLEARLRVKLLHRTTRRVSVTADGAAYYERTSRLLNDLSDIEASMTNAQANPSGRLRIDVGTAVARRIVIPALPDFARRYPEIQVDLGVTDRPVDLLGDNVDCVLRGGELHDQSLVARRIANLRMLTVASSTYVRGHGVPAHPCELEGPVHRTINYFSARTGRPFPHTFVRDGESLEIWCNRYQVAVNESNAHEAAVLAGLGVTQIPAFEVAGHLASGELVELLTDWSPPPIPVYAVYPPNRHLSAKVRAFVEWAVELFAGDAYFQV